MNWYFYFNRWDIWNTNRTQQRIMDKEESREKIKMIHILAKNSEKLLPEDQSVIGKARRPC